jgi:hypothetical protein
MEIKAIETVYNNYKFRSRLEARWAVFFDVLGIKYDYEKEGYDLGEEGYYLPDFWLPSQSIFAEVKGDKDGFWKSADKSKVEKLSKISGKNIVVLFSELCPFKTIFNGSDLSTFEGSNAIHYAIRENGWDDGLVNWGYCEKLNNFYPGFFGKTYAREYDLNPGDLRIINAYTRARQARFEHGESPRVSDECICENGLTFGVNCFTTDSDRWHCIFCGKTEIIKACVCNHMYYDCPYCGSHLT